MCERQLILLRAQNCPLCEVFLYCCECIGSARCVRYPEFVERFPLFGGFQCTNFNGRAIGTGNNVRYIEVVCSWEGPLIEVPL